MWLTQKTTKLPLPDRPAQFVENRIMVGEIAENRKIN